MSGRASRWLWTLNTPRCHAALGLLRDDTDWTDVTWTHWTYGESCRRSEESQTQWSPGKVPIPEACSRRASPESHSLLQRQYTNISQWYAAIEPGISLSVTATTHKYLIMASSYEAQNLTISYRHISKWLRTSVRWLVDYTVKMFYTPEAVLRRMYGLAWRETYRRCPGCVRVHEPAHSAP